MEIKIPPVGFKLSIFLEKNHEFFFKVFDFGNFTQMAEI